MLQAVSAYRFDRRQAVQAMHLLHGLERHTGTRLSAKLRRKADAYARDALGSRRFAPWLYAYAMVRGEWQDGWLPDGFLHRVVTPRVNGAVRHAASMKTQARRFYGARHLPDLLHLVSGHPFDLEGRRMRHNEARELLLAAGSTVVAKPDSASGGAGVVLLDTGTFDLAALARAMPNGVLQRFLTPHPAFRELGGEAGTTFRVITTRLPDGSVEAPAGWLSLPRSGEPIVRPGQVTDVVVDMQEGGTLDLATGPGWIRLPKPVGSTRRNFGAFEVPAFQAAREMCVTAHECVAQLGLVGWDVLIDQEPRPWILEANTVYPFTGISEAQIGPVYGATGWGALRPASR